MILIILFLTNCLFSFSENNVALIKSNPTSSYATIDFNVILAPYANNSDSYCTSISNIIETEYYSSPYLYYVYVYAYGEDLASDLEIVFGPTDQYIGSNTNEISTTQLAYFNDYNGYTSGLLTGNTLNTSFNEICFYNNCGGDTTNCGSRTNHFAGSLEIYGINMDSTKSGSGSASYIQYNDRLRVEFNISLYSWIYNSTYCLKVPETTNFDTTYYEASIHAFDYNYYNYLTDLEVYFLPTSEYIGSDFGQFASNIISPWPADYYFSSLTAIDSGKILSSLSSGFTEVCFANNCGSSYGCNLVSNNGGYNTFLGYIDLFGVTTTDISNVQLAAPTAQPTSNSNPTYYSPNNNYYSPNSPSKSDSNTVFPNKVLIESDTSSYATIDFNVILAPYANNSDSYCISISNIIETEYYSPPYIYYVYVYAYGEDLASDLEIVFGPTDQYIGSNTNEISTTQLAYFNDYNGYTSGLLTGNTLNTSFNEICFYNNCGGDTTNCGSRTNHFAGSLGIYGINMDSTKSGSGSASYIQYNDRLRVEFNISLYSWIYNSTYCLKVPETTNFDTTYYEASIHAFDYNYYNYLTDLEVYFLPTSEYIGSDYGQFASNIISPWPADYYFSSLTAIDSGKILSSLSSGFTEVCFANNCGGSYGCNLVSNNGGYNTFLGYIDLFGVTTTDISNVQLAAPTAQPTSNSNPTYYSPSNSYPNNNLPSYNNYPSNSYPSPSYTYPTVNYPSNTYPSSRYTSYPSPSYTYPTSNNPSSNSFNESYTWSSIQSSKATSWNDICTSISGQYVYAVASYDYIYKSSDYSNSYSIAYANKQVWKAIETSESGDIVVAAAYHGYIYISEDYGVSWSVVFEESKLWSGLSISQTNESCYAIAHNDYIYKLVDGGKSSEIVNLYYGYWTGITTDINRITYAVAKDGFIWRSLNDIWTIVNHDRRKWSAIATNYYGNYVYATVNVGHIYVSTDYGLTWRVSYSKNSFWTSITVNNNLVAYACDTLGTIVRSNNGSSWQQVHKSQNILTSIKISTYLNTVYATTFNDHLYYYHVYNYPTTSPTYSQILNV